MGTVGLCAFPASTLFFMLSMHMFHQNIHAHSTPSPIPSPGTRNLRVGVPWKTEFTEFVSVGKNGTNITGFCVEVFKAAIDTLSYSVTYIPYGDGNSMPNYNDLIGNITELKFDAIVGDVTITAERAQQVQFTYPFLDSGLVAVVRLMNEDYFHSGFSFLRPFSPEMWVLTVGFFITGGLVLYLLERRRNSANRQFGNIIWFSFSSLFTNQNDIKTVVGRIVVLVWLFVTGTLYSCYTANLSAILTAPRLKPTFTDINSVEASNVNIGFQNGSFANTYLRDNFAIDEQRLSPLNTEEEYFNALFSGRVDAIIDERPYMESLVAKHCSKLTFAGKPFTTQNFGFAFDYKHAVLAQTVSNRILLLSDNGTLESLRKHWLPYYHDDCNGYTQPGSGQIQVSEIWGIFLVSGLVAVIVIFIYMARWKWKASRVARQTPPHDSSDHGESFGL